MFLSETQDAEVTLNETEEKVLTQVAQSLGLLVTQEEAAALDKFMKVDDKSLNEAAKNIIKMTRMSKLNSLVSRSALVLARQGKDPLFEKFAKVSALRRKLRELIFKKYNSKALTTARKILSNAGKKNMVDVSSTQAFGNTPAAAQ